jgi:hypothetical protein
MMLPLQKKYARCMFGSRIRCELSSVMIDDLTASELQLQGEGAHAKIVFPMPTSDE